jgi:hypothetical protein
MNLLGTSLQVTNTKNMAQRFTKNQLFCAWHKFCPRMCPSGTMPKSKRMIWALVALLALRAGGAVEDDGTATGGNTPSGTCDASTSGIARCEHDDMNEDESHDALDHNQQGRSYQIHQTTLYSQNHQNDVDYPQDHEASSTTTNSMNPVGTIPDEECFDQNESCGYWARTGECQNNSNYMRRNCPLSCQLCTPHSTE